MKAMVIRSNGAPSVFEAASVEMATLKPGYVRVRVHATSVNPVDCKIRTAGLPIGPELPAVLHGDVAGVVEEVGAGVTRFAPGDRVFGCAGGVKGEAGALAEYMACDADLLAHLPDDLDFDVAAALPLVSITAWEGLVDKAKIGPDQTVLVHAGAGGVGHIAIQLAKARGARVFATISDDEKAEIAARFGATPINYREQSVADYVAAHTEGAGFDVVYDTVGGDNIARSWQATRHNGVTVSCQSNATLDMTPIHARGLTHAGVFMLIPMLVGRGRRRHGEIMTVVGKMAASGQIAPLIDREGFDLERVADAHAHWESGRAVGKIVVRIC